MIRLTLDLKGHKALEDQLNATERQVALATRRALNKTLRWARTRIARDVAQDTGIKVSTVKKALIPQPAKAHQLHATLGLPAKAGSVPAIHLGRARLTRTGTRVGKRHFRGAFVATMPGGHHGVFRRKGSGRLPIREVQVVMTGRIKAAMEQVLDHGAEGTFDKVFAHELRHVMGKT